jgi:hypothetical protein
MTKGQVSYAALDPISQNLTPQQLGEASALCSGFLNQIGFSR